MYSSDIGFTPTVKAIQTRKGSRRTYAAQEATGSWATEIDGDLKAFIQAQTSFFLASANAEGQPYIQHRGGPPGFLRVIDSQTIGFVDYAGNRQFITTGNLADNPKAYMFLIDYAYRRRIKIWGTARVVEGDAALTERLTALFSVPERLASAAAAASALARPQAARDLADQVLALARRATMGAA